MKNIILLSSLLVLLSCKNKCVDLCYTPPESLKLMVLDAASQNLLDPSVAGALVIEQVELSPGRLIDFALKDESFHYLASTSNYYFEKCTDAECELYIKYANSQVVDTINVLIEQELRESSSGCTCTSNPTRYIKHNQVEITEFNTDLGHNVAIIRR